MKVSVLALLAAPVLVLGSWGSHNSGAGVANHHANVARGIKAHPAGLHKRGPAKARHCAARTASLSSASVSSTSVLAHETTTTTTTTTTKRHTTTTTEKPKPTKNNNDDNNDDDGDDDNSGSSGGKTYSGDGTFYSTGLNACGTYDSDSDYIAALAHGAFDSYPGANGNSNDNPICNKKVNACYQGNCVTVRITDRCGGCVGDALDFSPSAFKQLASLDVGRIHGMTWHYV